VKKLVIQQLKIRVSSVFFVEIILCWKQYWEMVIYVW